MVSTATAFKYSPYLYLVFSYCYNSYFMFVRTQLNSYDTKKWKEGIEEEEHEFRAADPFKEIYGNLQKKN